MDSYRGFFCGVHGISSSSSTSMTFPSFSLSSPLLPDTLSSDDRSRFLSEPDLPKIFEQFPWSRHPQASVQPNVFFRHPHWPSLQPVLQLHPFFERFWGFFFDCWRGFTVFTSSGLWDIDRCVKEIQTIEIISECRLKYSIRNSPLSCVLSGPKVFSPNLDLLCRHRWNHCKSRQYHSIHKWSVKEYNL